MVFFSRLTDIVTCNLHSLLDGTDEPLEAIEGVLAEIEQGLAGAKRSVMAASNAVIRLEEEIESHRKGIASWGTRPAPPCNPVRTMRPAWHCSANGRWGIWSPGLSSS